MAQPLEMHPEVGGQRFTLRGIFRDEESAQNKLAQLEKARMDTRRFAAPGPKGTQLHFVVARHDLPPQYRAGMPHHKTADWIATAYAVRVFRMLVQASRKTRGPVRWYKRLDLEGLRKTVARYEMKGRLVDVAGNILSSTILAHPFPNANHRTSLSMARVYLEFMGVEWPGFTLKGKGQQRLHKGTHDFFRQSKYLLQLLRHKDMVRVAHEEGYTHLHIGPETDAQIVASDLELDPGQIRERHGALCRKTIRDVAIEDVRTRLGRNADRTLHDWVAWLKTSK